MKDWKKYAPVKRGDNLYPLSYDRVVKLHNIVRELPIEWHETTPREFRCEPGCKHCCLTGWFSREELDKLPLKHHVWLDRYGDIFNTQSKDGVCVFFEKDKSFHCSIAKYRPLRCRIYPFHPILDLKRDRIVILAQDIMIWAGKEGMEPATLCYGLGHGSDVSTKYKKRCRRYLLSSILEQSHSRFLWMGDPEEFIDRRALECRKKPLYSTYAECDRKRRLVASMLPFKDFEKFVTQGVL